MFVAVIDESITKMRGYLVPSSFHMGEFAFSAKDLIGKLCIPLANSKGGHS
jgi:hypothetical protein